MKTHRDAGSGGGVAHRQDGDVLGSVQPPHSGPGLTDPLHHRHIMFPGKRNSDITKQASCVSPKVSTLKVTKETFSRLGGGASVRPFRTRAS